MPMRADARRGQVHRQRRAQPAGADAEHARRLELLLPFHAHFRQDQVPAVALDLVGVQRHSAARLGRRRCRRRPTG